MCIQRERLNSVVKALHLGFIGFMLVSELHINAIKGQPAGVSNLSYIKEALTSDFIIRSLKWCLLHFSFIIIITIIIIIITALVHIPHSVWYYN